MRRYIITGSRHRQPERLLKEVFRKIPERYPAHEVTVRHGACPTGIDALADRLAQSLDLTIERFPADWRRHGKAAGPLPNQAMIDAGADLCLAFHPCIRDSKDTRDCAIRAVRAGIPTFLWHSDRYRAWRGFGEPADILER